MGANIEPPSPRMVLGVIEQVLRPVGDLITLSKLLEPYKRFVTVLVRRHRGVKLLLELDFLFGMRRYQVLITKERGEMSTFNRLLGRYVLREMAREFGRVSAVLESDHQGSAEEKGKKPAGATSTENQGGVKRRWRNTVESSGDGRNSLKVS